MTARLTVGFLLDVADLGRMKAPLLDTLLFAAVVDANVNRVLRDPALQAAYARLDTPPPDELRRPVSINALAESLDLPFETVRRHIRKLSAQGVCVATPQGLLAPTKVLVSPQMAEVQKFRYTLVVRFHEDLRAQGVAEPLPFRPLPADDPAAPIRGVGRVLSDYFFRTLGGLHGQVRDPLSALILLLVLQISVEHIPPGQAARLLRNGNIPDEARAPVRAVHISRRLRVPYETTRRHIGWLVDAGIFRRSQDGVMVEHGVLEGAAMQSLLQENLVNVRRLFRGLAALGPDAVAAPAPAREA